MSPAIISDLDMTFPASVKRLMPQNLRSAKAESLWSAKLFSDWFFTGIKSAEGLVAKPGIDKRRALRHIKCIMGSFEPSHEDKTAACALLLDLWFDGDKSTWERAE